MKVPISLQIAIRFSTGKQQGNVFSFVSIISIIGIALGMAVLIIGLSAMNGFKRELNNRILQIVPHGEIEPINLPFTNWQSAIKRIKQVPGILEATPYLNFTGLVEHNNKLQVIRIKGIDKIPEKKSNNLLKYIVKNNFWSNFQSGKNQIIIGKGIADNLQLKLGDYLTLTINNDQSNMKFAQSKNIYLYISGILVLNSQLDHNLALIPLTDAQNYMQRNGDIDGIAIKVNNIFNAKKLVQDASEVIDSYVTIRTWISSYGYMYHDIQMIRSIIYLSMIIVIIIASFNIISTLLISVFNKRSDIAILCILGAKNRLIQAIFFWHGLLNGLFGSTLGIIIGIFIGLNITNVAKGLEYLFNFRILSGDIYFISFLPTEIYLKDIVNIFILELSFSLIASWYPAKYASHINPSRILSKH